MHSIALVQVGDGGVRVTGGGGGDVKTKSNLDNLLVPVTGGLSHLAGSHWRHQPSHRDQQYLSAVVERHLWASARDVMHCLLFQDGGPGVPEQEQVSISHQGLQLVKAT